MNASKSRVHNLLFVVLFQIRHYCRVVSFAKLVLPAVEAAPWVEPTFLTPRGGNRSRKMSSGMTNESFESPSRLLKKLDSPSAQRNKEPIWQILSQKVFTTTCDRPLRIVQIAEGSGVHVSHFARKLASFTRQKFLWYPTDCDPVSRASIAAYIHDEQLDRLGVQPPIPLTLDASGIQEASTLDLLATGPLDLILCINMIHISPWDATLGLMKVSAQLLDESGVLFCYGPYKEGGTAVASNLAFDQNLKSRNPSWGVRDLEQVCQAALDQGLELLEKVDMPANNLCLIFRRKQ